MKTSRVIQFVDWWYKSPGMPNVQERCELVSIVGNVVTVKRLSDGGIDSRSDLHECWGCWAPIPIDPRVVEVLCRHCRTGGRG